MKLNQVVIGSLAFLSLSISSNLAADELAADSYQYEVAIGQSRLEEGPLDVNQTTIGGRYYFAPVSTLNGPRAEAAFINRSANVFATYQYNNIKTKWGMDGSISASQFGGVYTDKDSDLYLSGAITNVNNTGRKVIDGSVGWYFDDNWLVKLDVEREDNDFYDDFTNIGLTSKALFKLDSGHQVNAEFGYKHFDSDRGNGANNNYSVAGDYYLSNDLSVGLKYEWDAGGMGENSHATTLRSNWYFNDTMALNASYTSGSIGYSGSFAYMDSLSVGLNMRF